MARKLDSLVFFRPLAYLLGNILSDIFGDSFRSGTDGEEFDTTEAVGGKSAVVQVPEGAKDGVAGLEASFFSGLIVGDPRFVFFPIKAGANIPLALDDDVIVPGASFLPFPVPNPLTVKGREKPSVDVVEASRSLVVAFYVVGEGEGQKGAVFDTVEATKSPYVVGKGIR